MAPLGSCIDLDFYLVDCNDNTFRAAIDDRTCFMPDTSTGGLVIDTSYDPARCPSDRSNNPTLGLQSGTICLVAPEPDRGCDLNRDGVFYGLADSALLSDYFVLGPSVLDSMIEEEHDSLADCNFDGEGLTVSDLEYLVRIMRGELVFDPDHLFLDPYTSTLNLELERVGNDWFMTVRSSADVGTIWLEIEVPAGSTPLVRWLGDEAGELSARQTSQALRVLVTHWDGRDASGTNWPRSILITGLDTDQVNLTTVQASAYPGSPMVVNVTQ
jgi:hypothetical protein